MEEATRFGIMNVDENDQIYEFEEKPAAQEQPGLHGYLCVHLVQVAPLPHRGRGESRLLQRLRQNIIPAMLGAGEKLMAYRFHGYWKDVGTINSLWDANMDMLAPTVKAASTSMTPVGPSMPARPSVRPMSPDPTLRSPTSGHRRLSGGRLGGKFRACSIRLRWRRAPTSSTPSSCPALW